MVMAIRKLCLEKLVNYLQVFHIVAISENTSKYDIISDSK